MIDTNVEQSYKREEDKEEEVKQKQEIPLNLLQRLKRVRELWQKRSEPVICEGPYIIQSEEVKGDNKAFKVEMFNLDYPGGSTTNRLPHVA